MRLACLSALLTSALPLTLVLGANAGSVPLERDIIARDLTLGIVAATLALLYFGGQAGHLRLVRCGSGSF